MAHDIVPLPFDPSRLNGLSERMLRSYHEPLDWDEVNRRFAGAV
jgi:hypothetical protein